MLTDAQYLALHNDMLAQPSLAGAIAAGDDIAIAGFYNAEKSPATVVWKTRLMPEQYMRASLLAPGKRNASVSEALFATGTGTTANPATMAVEGPLSYQDASVARAWSTFNAEDWDAEIEMSADNSGTRAVTFRARVCTHRPK